MSHAGHGYVGKYVARRPAGETTAQQHRLSSVRFRWCRRSHRLVLSGDRDSGKRERDDGDRKGTSHVTLLDSAAGYQAQRQEECTRRATGGPEEPPYERAAVAS